MSPVTSSVNQPPPPSADDDFVRKPDPFRHMRISDNRFLGELPDRQPCPQCHASRRFFCYTCYLQLPDVPAFPAVRFPLKIDIIKHRKEIDGKSTSAHARLLAPADCRIFQYPDIPDYTLESGVVLIFPSRTSCSVQSLFTGRQHLDRSTATSGTLLRVRLAELSLGDGPEAEAAAAAAAAEVATEYDLDNLPVKRAVFIDSTWNQSRSIYKDPRMRAMRCVVLQHRLSQFWRHQKGSPRWYLSTVEAIHQFLLEVHVHAWGLDGAYRGLEQLEIGGPFAAGGDGQRQRLVREVKEEEEEEVVGDEEQEGQNEVAKLRRSLVRPYNGQYDDLLFLFSHMFRLIHTYYDHNKLKAYKRPVD